MSLDLVFTDADVLQKKEIQFYLDYTVQKYGKNFIELYNMEH